MNKNNAKERGRVSEFLNSHNSVLERISKLTLPISFTSINAGLLIFQSWLINNNEYKINNTLIVMMLSFLNGYFFSFFFKFSEYFFLNSGIGKAFYLAKILDNKE